MGCGTSRPPVANSIRTEPQARRKDLPVTDNSAPQSSPAKESSKNAVTQPEKAKAEYIDSRKFLELSYEEAAALRPSDPTNMWAVVKKTCDRRTGEFKLDSVKNRRGWKTIRLFVSSTFRDFHAEREVLVKEVMEYICFLSFVAIYVYSISQKRTPV